MKAKRFLTLVLALALVLTATGSGITAKASAPKSYLKVEDSKARVVDITPGKVTHVSIPVLAVSEYIVSPAIVATPEKDAPFTISEVTMRTKTTKDPAGISSFETTYLEFDITTKDSAAIGIYDYTIETIFSVNGLGEDGYYTNSSVTENIALKARVAKELAPIQIVIDNVKYDEDEAVIGNTFDLSFDVKNEGEIKAMNTYLNINFGDTLMIPGYSVESIKVGDLAPGETKKMKVSIKVLPTATDGYKTIGLKFDCKDSEGTPNSVTRNAYITIAKTSTGTSEDAKLTISGSNVNDKVIAGASYTLAGSIKNIGLEKATNVEVSIIDGIGSTTGVIPKYEGDTIALPSIQPDGTAKFSLPLLVTETAAAGLREISVKVTYQDSQGTSRSAVVKSYLTVVQTEKTDAASEVVITNVSQSPAEPLVGQKVTVTFDIENKGATDVTGLSVGGQELSSTNFEPYTAQATKEVGTLKAGAKKSMSLDFRVGASIMEGLNTLKIGYTYTDTSGKKVENVAPVYILNVVNDSNSKPKVILSNFSKDSEELKAGTTFNFIYDLKNTHASKAAKNIKVTISQAENVFSATQGTNSFYIDRIEAGETVEGSLEMKVKSDVATGAYELEIKVEYEYDDMSKVDTDNGGVTETSKIKLQALENLRPRIQDVSAGNGDSLTMGNPTSLTFSFINMGKSPLNNVQFKLEGDFTLETGDSYFFGSMAPSQSEYMELAVVPNNSGMCGGTIIAVFEDSNSNEVEWRYDFSNINVMEQMSFDDPGMGGFDDPGFPAFEEQPEEPKKIMPVWAFIIMQAAILAIFIPVVRIIIIKVYKKKHEDQDEI